MKQSKCILLKTPPKKAKDMSEAQLKPQDSSMGSRPPVDEYTATGGRDTAQTLFHMNSCLDSIEYETIDKRNGKKRVPSHKPTYTN